MEKMFQTLSQAIEYCVKHNLNVWTSIQAVKSTNYKTCAGFIVKKKEENKNEVQQSVHED